MESQSDNNYSYSPADYLYSNGARSHPIEDYNPPIEIRDSTSLTPAFVLDVNFPRLVQFYHPTSPICQSFQSTYLEIARLFRREFSNLLVTFHAVSCTAHIDVCSSPEFDIHAVPVLLAYPVGSIKGHIVKRTDDNRLVLGHVADSLGLKLPASAGNAHSIIIGSANSNNYSPENIGDDDKELFVQQKLYEEQQNPNRQKVGVYAAHAGKFDQIIVNQKHSKFYLTQERAFQDAAASFLLTLDRNIYPPESVSVDTKLSIERTEILRDFLDLCHWTLPSSWILRSFVNDLRNNFHHIANSRDSLREIIYGQHDHPNTWKFSVDCQSVSDAKRDYVGDAYNCGLWKLFHIIGIGVVEQHKSVMGDRSRVSPSYATWVIRDFVEIFLIDGALNKSNKNSREKSRSIKNRKGNQLLWCNECRDGIVESFDQCKFGLCSKKFQSVNLDLRQKSQRKSFLSFPLFSRSPERRYTDGWTNVAEWLWEIHNEVHVSIKSNEYIIGDMGWPTEDDCPDCYVYDLDKPGSFSNQETKSTVWDRDAVYEYLKKVYWPSGVQNPRVIVLKPESFQSRKYPKRRQRLRSNGYYLTPTEMCLCLVCTVTCFRLCWMKKHALRKRFMVWKRKKRYGVDERGQSPPPMRQEEENIEQLNAQYTHGQGSAQTRQRLGKVKNNRTFMHHAYLD